MTFEWSDKYAVGVPVIDAQHRELLDHIHSLIEALQNYQSQAVIAPMVQFLENHLIAHCLLEEALMKKNDYFDINAHLVDHKQLIRDFISFKKIFDQHGVSTMTALKIQKITDLLIFHFSHADTRMAVALKAKL